MTMASMSHGTPSLRLAAAEAICAATWRVLPGYALGSLLLAAVLTRVVATTAASYDLSHLALEAMVRVFVVELLPLAAALFVAMRSGLAALATFARQPAQRVDLPLWRQRILPGVIGSSVAVVTLTLVSSSLALLIAYPVMHGFTPWALPAYTRLIGQVFDPVTALVLAWKVTMFGLVIGLLPAAAMLSRRSGSEGRVLALLLASLLMIEIIALGLLRL